MKRNRFLFACDPKDSAIRIVSLKEGEVLLFCDYKDAEVQNPEQFRPAGLPNEQNKNY